MAGRFITFEGGEGAGKSTHIRLLADRLRAVGIGVVVTREPGGSPGAEYLRHVLLSGAAEKHGPVAEAILFAAARIDHVDQTIRPALERGEWVLCDRFYDSTRVYQRDGDGVDPELVTTLERVAVDGVRPDLTLILDLPVDIGLERITKRRGGDAPDRFEKEDTDVHQRRRDAFLRIAADEPDRCVVIDASASLDAVAEDIWSAVCERFGLLPAAAELRNG